MQIDPQALYTNYTIRTISNAISGYFEHEQQRERNAWERSRWELFNLLNIQIEPKKRLKTVKEIALFPWEEEEKPKKVNLTKDQFEQLIVAP